MRGKPQRHIIPIVLGVLSGLLYILIQYFIPRYETFPLLIILSLVFFAYGYLAFSKIILSTKAIFYSGLVFRLLVLFSLPVLSEDVYRFIWDGRLLANGVNPYLYLPAEVLQQGNIPGIDESLLGSLNSASYYSLYPPVIQALSFVAAKISPQNIFIAVLVFKLVILLADVGTFFIIKYILKKLGKPPHLTFIFFLNPLVILELTGNCHLEGIVVFFMLAAVWLLMSKQLLAGAVVFGLAIATKLLPALLLPLFIHKLGWRKGIYFCMISGTVTLMLFSFLLSPVVLQHIGESLNLYFQHFEFNGSLYYLVRWIGFQFKGYNIIQYAGPVLILMAAISIFAVSFLKKIKGYINFFETCLFIFSIWLAASTTVHPWYLVPLVAFSVFVHYKYALAWSFTAMWSYSAYHVDGVRENLWIIAFGYILVAVFFLWELYNKPLAQLPAVSLTNDF
ncbi:MAG: hypothetical protein ABIT96_11620 [Ferruginibacter sp.]